MCDKLNISLAKPTQDKNNFLYHKKIPRRILVLEITGEETGFTIQALGGIDYIFSDAAVIVKTYKVNILLADIDAQNNIIKTSNQGSFNVTRDSWYYIGTKTQANEEIINETLLLNREFVPDTYEKNRYTAYWLPNYPKARIQNALRKLHIPDAGLNAFKLTRFGSSELPAKPLTTQETLENKSIHLPRKDPNIATDVLLHIGGTYSLAGYDWLGGSYGCFGFIPQNNIYESSEKAEKAVNDDLYDETISNVGWKEVCKKILELTFPSSLKIEIHLKEKNQETYIPQKILKE